VLGEAGIVGMRGVVDERTNMIALMCTVADESGSVVLNNTYTVRGPQANWGHESFQGAAAVEHATVTSLSEGLNPRLMFF